MPNTNGPVLRPYNIVVNDDGSAEVNMYGEVVDRRPTDFWTGKPIDGNFIVLSEFLRDLDELRDKSSITVHINSVGGDMYAGIAIYNRLKELSGHVTTVNDGLAASAGSLIFMAGDTRKVNAGSNIMIHGAAGLLWGYYQVQDLRAAIKQLEAHNKAAVNIYAERTGRPAEEIKPMVDRETWLTGQDAVTAGFATEVVETSEPVKMSLTADRAHLVVNGVSMSTRGLGKIPEGIPVMPANFVSATAPAPEVDKSTTPETRSEEKMDIKNMDELRAAFPDLMAQVENAARDAGAKAERARIQGIEAIENAVADRAMVHDAKFGANPLTAEQLAFKAMQAQAAIGANMLGNMAADTKASGAANVTGEPNKGPEAVEPEPVDAAAEIGAIVNAYTRLNGGKK